ncbi:hypothetical protein E3N88_18267 [Mikania micrantha]|uniref:DUF4219 domain-containing protein n=1 Tax=Mikania micrantha TaxID=192012 RepID=A0A5N6NUD8_9ASTR|nr:hypothetical protein E3N88_18267 [Mikania micrantha]
MTGANQGGGDGVLVPAREQNHVSLQCPKLTTTNYTPWAIMLETILKAQGIWDAIDPVTRATVDARKNYTTKAIIYQSLHEDILLQVARYEFAKDVWEAIRVRFLRADQHSGDVSEMRGDLLDPISQAQINLNSGQPWDPYLVPFGRYVLFSKSYEIPQKSHEITQISVMHIISSENSLQSYPDVYKTLKRKGGCTKLT